MIKEKGGRPVEMKDNERGRAISLYLEQDMVAALDELHWRERKSVSNLVRLAIQDYLKAHGEGNSTFTLDIWNKNPTFKAVPTLWSDKQTWQNYIRDCSDDDLTKAAIAANIIKNEVYFARHGCYQVKF